jgi:hypothetical protein
MKKYLFLIIALLFVSAQARNPYEQRYLDNKIPIAESGSYGYVLPSGNISNISTVRYNVSDTLRILAICIQDSGTLFVSTKSSDSIPLYSPDFQCYPLEITKVFPTSLHFNLFGHKNK